jgi:hypothetical protein
MVVCDEAELSEVDRIFLWRRSFLNDYAFDGYADGALGPLGGELVAPSCNPSKADLDHLICFASRNLPAVSATTFAFVVCHYRLSFRK